MIRANLKSFLLLSAMLGLVGAGWVARSLIPDAGLLSMLAVAAQETDRAIGPASANRALPVRVLRLGSLAAPDRTDRYRGTIDASKSADLSFRRGGRLAAIQVREGDQVQAGQLLAILETDDVKATIRGVESRIKEAEAVLAEQVAGPRKETISAAQAVLKERESAHGLARITLEREERLLKSQASSGQAYDEAKTALERSSSAVDAAREQLNELLAGTRQEQINAQKARIDSLKAQLDDLQVQLADCQLLAPFAGVVALRFADEGIIASPERAIVKLLQVEPLEARFGVAAEDAAMLQIGQEVVLTANEEVVAATVSRIEPELDQATRTQGVIVSVSQERLDKDTTGSLIPGQTVSLSIGQLADEGSSQDASMWVPIQSLSRSVRGLWSVMKLGKTVDKSWIVERHIVQVMEVNGPLCRINGSTLSMGELIVSEGIHRLTPGMRVEPMGLKPNLNHNPTNQSSIGKTATMFEDTLGDMAIGISKRFETTPTDDSKSAFK